MNDYAFSEFVSILEWIAKKHGTRIVRIVRYYPSSQICSNCGWKNEETKNLGNRVFDCPSCHHKIDRDLNASVNILGEALRMIEAASAQTG